MQKKQIKKPPLPLVQGITIDGKTSKDLDDAIMLRDIGNDTYILDISIAQIADFVPYKSRLFQRSYDRVVTMYHATGNDPMLPRSLSEKKASLLPDGSKAVVQFRIWINKKTLEVTDFCIREAIFRSKGKYSYQDVQSIIIGEKKGTKTLTVMLRKLDTLAQKLLAFRRKAGALAIYDINKGWRTTEEGQLVRVTNDGGHRGEIIVQEMMILTNRLSATYLQQRNIPSLVRNHTAKVSHFNMHGIMQEYEHILCVPEEEAIRLLPKAQELCNISMNRATYGVTSVGHVGLMLPIYGHFTSPIRRFADLINQYIIIAHLRKQDQLFVKEELESLCDYINERLESMRDKVASSYKEKWKTHVVYLAENKTEFSGMTHKEISGLIKLTSMTGDCSSMFLDEIIRRLHNNMLQPIDFFRITFAKESTEFIQLLQTLILQHMTSDPTIAKAVVEMGQSRLFIKNYVVSAVMKTQTPPLFVTTGEFIYHDTRYTVPEKHSSTKKMGDQMLCVDVCSQIMKLPIPEVTRIAPKKSVSSATNITHSQLPLVVHNDYVSAIHLFMQAEDTNPPVYDFIPCDKELGFFTANVSYMWKEKMFTSTGYARGKKSAKNLASKALYEKLQKLVLK